nr:hypothetical protein BaRGS_024870 [Batillaria attramentaria]
MTQEGEADTGRPEETDTGRPEEADTGRPEEADTGKPEEADTGRSEERTDTGRPEEADTGRPEEADTGRPEEADTGRPAEADTGRPEEADTGRPEETPACAGDDEDIPSSSQTKRHNLDMDTHTHLPSRETSGKTGTGKSTVGNILLGRVHFPVCCTMTSTTTDVTEGCSQIHNITLKVVDTPDISEMDMKEQEKVLEVSRWKARVVDTPDISEMDMKEQEKVLEVSRWKARVEPGHYAVVLTVRCDRRYTAEEYAIYQQIKKLWKDNSFCDHLVVALTFGDRLDGDLDTQLKIVCPELQHVLRDAGKRYVLFNDMATEKEKVKQIDKLVHEVNKIAACATSVALPMRNESTLREAAAVPTLRRDGVKEIRLVIIEDVQLEIAKSIATVTPGPHAVLVVLKAGERFTKEESQAYDELKQLFGDDITSFMIVVFTGVDLLERSGLDLASAMQRAPPKVVQIMREAGNRLDNKATKHNIPLGVGVQTSQPIATKFAMSLEGHLGENRG